MSVPLNHVADAAEFLTNGLGTPKEKLVIGGKMLRMAMMIGGELTPNLRKKAGETLVTLLQGGTLETTVAQMDEKAASKCLNQLTKDVRELTTGIEQARLRHK